MPSWSFSLVVRRTSSDLRLDPLIHAGLLDGVFCENGDEVWFHGLPRLSTSDVTEGLEDAIRRITCYLRRRGLLDEGERARAPGPGGERRDRERTTAARRPSARRRVARACGRAEPLDSNRTVRGRSLGVDS